MSTVAILIPTMPKRAALLNQLVDRLFQQAAASGRAADVDILCLSDAGKLSIGAKRNELLNAVKSEYCCFIDDDDWPGPAYIPILLRAADSGSDCAALSGTIYSVDRTGHRLMSKPFEHSVRHSRWCEVDGRYLRPPNHLNLVRSDIAKAFPFEHISRGEDADWSMRIHRAGALATEYADEIGTVIYHYAPSDAFGQGAAQKRKHAFDASHIRRLVR